MKVIACEKREDTDKRKDGVCGEMRAEYIHKKSLVIFSYVISLKEFLDFGCLSCFNRAQQITPANSQVCLAAKSFTP